MQMPTGISRRGQEASLKGLQACTGCTKSAAGSPLAAGRATSAGQTSSIGRVAETLVAFRSPDEVEASSEAKVAVGESRVSTRPDVSATTCPSPVSATRVQTPVVISEVGRATRLSVPPSSI